MKVLIDIPDERAHSLAAILEMYANERRTPSGAISRSGKGDYTYTEEFRGTLKSAAAQIRDAAEAQA